MIKISIILMALFVDHKFVFEFIFVFCFEFSEVRFFVLYSIFFVENHFHFHVTRRTERGDHHKEISFEVSSERISCERSLIGAHQS